MAGTPSVGQTFTIIKSSSTVPVNGTFAQAQVTSFVGGSQYVFGISYGANGENDVIATLQSINLVDLLDVAGGVASLSAPGANLNVSIVGSNYVISDTVNPVNIDANAAAAGWSVTNSTTLTGPVAGITQLALTGISSESGITAGAPAAGSPVTTDLTITGPGSGSLALNGAVAATGNVTVSGYSSVDAEAGVAAGAAVSITAPSITDGAGTISTPYTVTGTAVSLTASTGVGSSALPFLIGGTSPTVTVSAGTNGAYLDTANGAVFTGNVTGAGNLSVVNTTGGLTVAGASTTGTGTLSLSSGGSLTTNAVIGGSTTTGNIVLSSAGALTVNANIGSTAETGTITLSADTAGTGAAGTADYTQGATVVLTTENTTASGLTINVNTPTGGTSNAVVAGALVGAEASAATNGTYTVNAFAGSIFDNTAETFPNHVAAAAPSFAIRAFNFTFNSNQTGTGSIGTDFLHPLVIDDTAETGSGGFVAGSGGIYVLAFGNGYAGSGTGYDFTVNQAISAGAGNIFVQTANEGGHNLDVTGPVWTSTGSIELDADDYVAFSGTAAIGGTYNSTAFSGTVTIITNMDAGNNQALTMAPGSSIVTTSTSPNAVLVEQFDTAVPSPGMVIGNVMVGNGGGITLNAAADRSIQSAAVGHPPVTDADGSANTTRNSSITQLTGTTLNAGAAGTVTLLTTNLTAAVGGDIGTTTQPISVAAGNVVAQSIVASSTSTIDTGNIYVTDSLAATIAASTESQSLSSTGVISLADTGGPITLAGNVTTTGGAVTVTGQGITIPVGASLGGIATGTATGTGPLTISAGANPLAVGGALIVGAGQTATVSGSTFDVTGSLAVGAGSTVATGPGLTLEVGSGGALTEAGAATITGSLQVDNGATVTPAVVATGTSSVTALTLAPGSNLTYQAGQTAAFTTLPITTSGPVSLNGANLNLGVYLFPTVGQTFTIIKNNSGSTVNGQFAQGTTVTANESGSIFTFSINYAGGPSGNDVVATVTSAVLQNSFDVTNGVITFTAPTDTVAVTQSGTNYVVNDSTDTITLDQNAMNAGWTGGGTNQVTGPIAGITQITLQSVRNLAGATLGTSSQIANLTVTGFGNLSVSGPVSTAGTGNLTLNTYSSVDIEASITVGGTLTSTVSGITDGAATTSTPGTVVASKIVLTSATSVGSSALPLLVGGTNPTVTVSAGSGGAYLTTANGVVFTGTDTGGGNLSVTNEAGLLSVAGATSVDTGNLVLTSLGSVTTSAVIGGTTTTGNIAISSAGALNVNANIGTSSDSGTITLSADTAGTGTAGTADYTQGTAVVLTTTSNAASGGVVINVNSSTGGTANAVVAGAQVGQETAPSTYGTYTVNSYGGAIFDNPAETFPNHTAATVSTSAPFAVRALNFFLNSNQTGTGGIGTDFLHPFVVDASSSSSAANFVTGSGGIYVLAFGNGFTGANGYAFGVTQAISAGAGNIFIQTSNEGGHNLYTSGQVWTGTGSIELDADDEVAFNSGTMIGGVYNGAAFGGTVTVHTNLDTANSQQLQMASGTSIVTTNTSSTAVVVEQFVTKNAVMVVSNITVGNGGTISLNAAADASIQSPANGYPPVTDSDGTGNGNYTSRDGSISQLAGTTLTAGASGSVILSGINLTAALGGDIGSSTQPILVSAGNVVANSVVASSSTITDSGDIYVTDLLAATISASTESPTLTSTGVISLTDTGGPITLAGKVTTTGGTVTIASTGTNGGVVIPTGVILGGTASGTATATGPITITGPLSGSGTINSSSGVTLNESGSNSTFGGAITGSQGLTVASTSGTLTLSGANSYTGLTNINGGVLAVTGSLTGNVSEITVANGADLTGTGTISSPVTVNGTISTPTPATGVTPITVGGVSMGQTGSYAVTLAGTTPGAGYSQIISTGAISVGGNLSITIGSGTTLTTGEQFTIIKNTGNQSASGSFSSITVTNNPLANFTTSFDANGNLILTVGAAPASITDEIDVGTSQVKVLSAIGVNNNISVTDGSGVYTVTDTAATAASPIYLSQAAVNAGWTLTSPTTAHGPDSGVMNFLVDTYDGLDTLNGLNVGNANLLVVGAGQNAPSTLTLSGTVTAAGTATFNSYASIAGGTISAPSGVSIADTAGQATALTLGGINVTSGSLSISGVTTLTVDGNLADQSGTVTATAVDIINGTGGLISTGTLNLTGTDAVGSSVAPVLTTAGLLTLTGGDNGVSVSSNSPSGATVAATATGAGAINVSATAGDLTLGYANGTVAVSGATNGTGAVNVTAAGAVILGGAELTTANPVPAILTAGPITITANTGSLIGAGQAGFSNGLQEIVTTNTSAGAVSITVDGAADADIAWILAGSNQGGTISVTAQGGNIVRDVLVNSFVPLTVAQTGYQGTSGGIIVSDGGSAPGNILEAQNYVFSAPLGGIGSPFLSLSNPGVPLQLTNFTPQDTKPGYSNVTATAGMGGISWLDWGPNDITVDSAVATGGDVQLVAANAGGHNLFVSGPVTTGNGGNIRLYADDDLVLTGPISGTGLPTLPGATVGVTSGNPSFAGTVDLQGNRDGGNAQVIWMQPGSSVATLNNSATAVTFNDFSSSGSSDTGAIVPNDVNLVPGGIDLANVTVGSGGTITVDAGTGLPYTTGGNQQGDIIQEPGTTLNAGSGSVVLIAGASDTTTSSGGFNAGNIGVGGTTTAPVLLPINVVAATVTATTTGTNLGNSGNIDIVATGNTRFTANTTPNTTSTTDSGTINLSTTSGVLTVVGSTGTTAGNITLTSTGTSGGVTLSAPVTTSTGNLTVTTSANPIDFTLPYSVPAGTTTTFNANSPTSLTQTTTVSAGATLSDPNGLVVSTGGVLNGTGTVNATLSSATITESGGSIHPGLPTGNLTVNELTLPTSGGQLAVTLNSSTAFSSLAVGTGGENLSGTTLTITVGQNLSAGGSFQIIDNTATTNNTVNGMFANAVLQNGVYVVAATNPSYVFTVTTPGGNTVVLTLRAFVPTDNLDVTNGVVTLGTVPGVNNSISVTTSPYGTSYTITDVVPINLNQDAVTAGWAEVGGNPDVVSGPTASVTAIALNTADGSDAIAPAGISAGSANVSIQGGGTLTIGGAVTTTGALTVGNYTSVVQQAPLSATVLSVAGLAVVTQPITGGSVTLSNSGNIDLEAAVSAVGTLAITSTGGLITDGAATTSTPATLTAASVSLTGTGIGSTALPVLVGGTSPTLTVSAGAGGAVVATSNGALLTGTVTGAGNLNVANATGTLTVAGPTTSITGNINLSSGGALTVNANIGTTATNGTITLSADTAGTGSAGTADYTQGMSVILTTENTTTSGLTINVNSSSGGTANAVVAGARVGPESAGATSGTYTVNSFGGSIFDNPAESFPNHTATTAPSYAIRAYTFSFNSTQNGTGSIGTSNTVPLIIDTTNSSSSGSFVAGSGGIYVLAFGNGYAGASTGYNFTVAQALSSGFGNIFIQTSNETGHNLMTSGPIWTQYGSIELDADDTVNFNAGTVVGGTQNGLAFAGDVAVHVNLDLGNNQQLNMAVGTSITTTSTDPNAVVIEQFPTKNGILTLSNITVGNGGGIILNPATDSSIQSGTPPVTDADGIGNNSRDGSIAQLAGTVLSAGPLGTITLIGTNGSPATSGYTGGDVGSSGQPITVSAGNVVAVSYVPNGGYAGGDIYLTDALPATITAVATNPTAGGGIISLADTGGPITLGTVTATSLLAANNGISTAGGSVTISAPDTTGSSGPVIGGVIIPSNVILGSSSTGSIAVTGELSGAGSIQLGTGSLTVVQTGNSTFGGTITGSQGFTYQGTGVLTLNGNNTYTGTTSVTGGVLAVASANPATITGNTVSVSAGATLGGDGTVTSPVSVSGTLAPSGVLSPGVGGIGILTTGALTFSTGGRVSVTLESFTAPAGIPGTDYDQVVSSGSVNLTNAALSVSLGFVPATGEAFTILTSASPVTGFFSVNGTPATNGSTVTFQGQSFTINYNQNTTGGNVVLTAAAVAPTVTGISPASALVGSPATTITLTGANFTSNAVVNFNGTALSTSFVSPSTLTAVIPATDLTAVGTSTITVTTSVGTSSGHSFTVTAPIPTITNLTPNAVPSGSAATTLTVTGTNLTTNSVVQFNGSSLATTFVNSTTVTAVIPSSDLITLGNDAITIIGEGETSNHETFTVAPSVTAGVLINNGNVQRSLVTQVTVVFNGTVTAASVNQLYTFTLTRQSDGSSISNTGGNISVTNPNGDGKTYVLTFTGLATVIQNGSLADGVYVLNVHLNGAPASTDFNSDTSGSDRIYRLFGDFNGDGSVNGADFAAFAAAYNAGPNDPNYQYYFDFTNSDQGINSADFTQFSDRYGTSL